MSTTRIRLVAVVGASALLAAACGGGDDTAETTATPAPVTEAAPSSEPSPTEAMTTDAMTTEATEPMASETTSTASESAMAGETETMAAGPTGSDCSMLPDDAEALAERPLQEAAAEIPELSTLVSALTLAGMDTSLDSGDGITLFAPVDAGFDALPADTLQSVMADPGQVESILQLHVADGRLDSTALAEAGTVTTRAGVDLEFDAEALTVSTPEGSSATVVCADVETVNATVHLIDGVLLPQG